MRVSQNGWPVNPPRRSRTVPGSSVRLTVADGPAGDVLMYVAHQFDQRVEDIDTARGATPDDWGHADRPIAGSTVTSNHASATAIDLNALKHVRGKRGTFTPAQRAVIAQILKECRGVVRWGGDYSTTVDEMHFEINADEGAVTATAQLLSAPKPAPPRPAPPTGRATLREGSRGPDVSFLQRHMNHVYPLYSKLQVDGIFGPKTARVIREFQRRSGITADGIVGPVTWRKLGF